jgi:hypothetical protein
LLALLGRHLRSLFKFGQHVRPQHREIGGHHAKIDGVHARLRLRPCSPQIAEGQWTRPCFSYRGVLAGCRLDRGSEPVGNGGELAACGGPTRAQAEIRLRQERQCLAGEDVDCGADGDRDADDQGKDNRWPAAAESMGDDGKRDADAGTDRRSRPRHRHELAERGEVFLLQPREAHDREDILGLFVGLEQRGEIGADVVGDRRDALEAARGATILGCSGEGGRHGAGRGAADRAEAVILGEGQDGVGIDDARGGAALHDDVAFRRRIGELAHFCLPQINRTVHSRMG